MVNVESLVQYTSASQSASRPPPVACSRELIPIPARQPIMESFIEIGDRAVVLAGVEHDEVDEGVEGEAPPDSEIVVHIDLAVQC